MRLDAVLETVSEPATTARMPSSIRCRRGGGGVSGRSSLFCIYVNPCPGVPHVQRTYKVMEEVASSRSTLQALCRKVFSSLVKSGEGFGGSRNVTQIHAEPRYQHKSTSHPGIRLLSVIHHLDRVGTNRAH